MEYFCIEDFKVEFEKLIAKKKYNDLESEIVNYFFGKTIDKLCNGIRLNGENKNPYIKKRLKGRGGYRFYFLLVIQQSKLYFMFVHPKTGPMGSDNITDESKAYIYKKVLDCIKRNDLYKVEVIGNKLCFERTTPFKI